MALWRKSHRILFSATSMPNKGELCNLVYVTAKASCLRYLSGKCGRVKNKCRLKSEMDIGLAVLPCG